MFHKDVFSYTVCDTDGAAAIATGHGPAMDFFADFIHDWEDMRKKLDNHEITKNKYENWKHA